MMKNPLLLLHGALGCKDQWGPLQEKMAGQPIFYMFNFSGHGGQLVPEKFSIKLFVHDTLTFMDLNELDRVDIFGYSMGGYVALQLALEHPERVEKIITLGTRFDWTPESAARDVRMMDPEIIEQKIPAFATTLHYRHAPQDWKQVMRQTANMMTALGNGAAMTEDDFKYIPHPALICIGTQDHMVSQEESAWVANMLPAGHLECIEGFKHPFESVDQDTLAQIIISFLSVD